MKPNGPLALSVVVFIALLSASLAPAQLPWRLFGSKNADKGVPVKSQIPEYRRVVEINVEVAWLADPTTFPYYLEAHVTGGQQLEVRGFVPNKAVREHALRIAQVYSSMPVTDSMKEHPSLLVRPGQMSPQQLHSSVLSSLRVALPKQHQQFKVECSNDGKVVVTGPVTTYDEKIAVSHSLRRLHGCTSVQNLTSVPEELARAVANPPREIVQEQPKAPPDGKSKTWIPWSTAKSGTTKQEPPIAEPKKADKETTIVDVRNKENGNDKSILIPPVAKDRGPDLGLRGSTEVIKVELPGQPARPALSAAELQKRIRSACPKATNVDVTFVTATELRIVIDTREASEINAIADRIFAMPELQNYRPELQFKIAP